MGYGIWHTIIGFSAKWIVICNEMSFKWFPINEMDWIVLDLFRMSWNSQMLNKILQLFCVDVKLFVKYFSDLINHLNIKWEKYIGLMSKVNKKRKEAREVDETAFCLKGREFVYLLLLNIV